MFGMGTGGSLLAKVTQKAGDSDSVLRRKPLD